MTIIGFTTPVAQQHSLPIVLDRSQATVVALADDVSASVIGAPGSGKTTTLIELVAERVLGRGWAPESVLVISASRASATRLRDTLAVRLAVPTLGPLARTATSVAFQVVRDEAVRRDREQPRLLTGAEQDQILAELLEGEIVDGLPVPWPEPLNDELRRLPGFRSELRDLLMRAEEYGVSADRLADLGAEYGRPEWAAAARFLTVYRRVLAFYRGDTLDSSELVAEAAQIVEGGSDLGGLNSIRLIVLDDAQELSESVISFVRALASRGIAVIAFGDPDVAVGSFRGARPEILGTLGASLGIAAVVPLVLEGVHRHGPGIRSVVARITGRIGAAAAGTQRAAMSVGLGSNTTESVTTHIVDAVTVSSGSAEIALIARRLREAHILDGVPWSRLAVIVRSGSTVPALARGLAALEVPTQLSTAGTALRDERVVRAIVLMLEVGLGRVALSPVVAVTLLTGPFGGLDAVTLRRLRVALRHEELAGDGDRPGDEVLVEAFRDESRFATIDTRVARQAAALARSITLVGVDAEAGMTIEELFWGIWSRSGLDRQWYEQSMGTGLPADEGNHNLDAIVALFATAKRFVERTPDNPPSVFLDAWAGADVPEDTLAPRSLGEAVSIGTPAGVIGRQFHTVIVAGVQEGVWPNPRLRGSLLGAQALVDVLSGRDVTKEGERSTVMNDELRLFAAAVSRAEHSALITAVNGDEALPSPFFRLILGAEPAKSAEQRYPLSLRGLVGRLRRVVTEETHLGSAQERGAAASALAKLAEEGVPGADPADWYGLAPRSTEAPLVDLDDPTATVRISPSRMETFETCGLHWLIDEVGGGTSNSASNLGTIVHSVAQNVVTEQGSDLSAERLWRDVETRWGELRFDSAWESQLEQRRARQITGRLSSYLNDFRANGGTLVDAELQFELSVGRAMLRGTIDRVELLSTGVAIIVDLKTGKNEPTSDAAVAGHAQLGAYQLAFDSGAIAGIPNGVANGGAKLVVLSSGTQKQNYRNPSQAAFDETTLAEFRGRVEADALGMAGSVFVAQIDAHCLDPYSYGSCAIHVVRAVSG